VLFRSDGFARRAYFVQLHSPAVAAETVVGILCFGVREKSGNRETPFALRTGPAWTVRITCDGGHSTILP
jgi:hypothetical protein